MYETVRMMEIIHSEETVKYTNIQRLANSIEDFEWFKAYKSSSRWFTQFNGDEALINNKQA